MSQAVHSRHGAWMAVLSVLLLGGMLVTLGGCNTVAGMGQDVSAAGQGVTKAADKAKQGL
jgi:predicted small secreted protein